MATIHGDCVPGAEPVRALMAASIESGSDVGLSVCAIQDGRVIADLWGGISDAGSGAAWERDTIINTWSITKTMTALSALLLVDRGELDLDAPVAKYWPEFAAEGKEGVLVRHIMSHTSGLSGWQEPIVMADMYDADKSSSLLAAQAPWWEPGTASGYHLINQGFLVGEVIRRITGDSLGSFFRRELAVPLEADYFIGTPASEDARIATLIPPTELGVDLTGVAMDSVMMKSLINPMVDISELSGRGWRGAEIGAANGHGNARSVATVQSVVSHADPKFLHDSTIARIFETQSDGVDLVLGIPIRFGIGYGLVNESTPELRAGRVCWWTGYGGSVVVNDLDNRLTFAYVMNRMEPALIGLARAGKYLDAVYEAVEA